MIKTFSVSSNNLKRGDSLVPEFYYYSSIVKDENIKKGFEYIKLGSFPISDGEHTAIPRNNDSGIRYLYGRNIRESCIDFDPISDVPYIDIEDYERIKRTHIKQDDVLMPIVGTIGKSAIYKQEYVGEAGIPRHIAHITIDDTSKITPEYLSVFFRSKYGKVQLNSLTTGNIQPLLSLTNLKTVEVPIISENDIKKITDNEKTANNYMIESNKLLEEAKNKFYSSLGFDIKSISGDFSFSIKSSKMIDNDIWTPNHYNLLYDNINKELENNLKMVKLGDLVEESFHGDEIGSDNYNTYIDKESTDIPFIRTSDIVNNMVDLYPDFYGSEELCNEYSNKIKEKDVIFTKDGKIGATAMITKNDKCVLSSGIQILRINEYAKSLGITQEYLFLALSIKEIGYYEAIKRTVVASTIPHLRPERLKEILIPVIDKEIIKQISNLVEKSFEYKSNRIPLLFENDKIIENAFI